MDNTTDLDDYHEVDDTDNSDDLDSSDDLDISDDSDSLQVQTMYFIMLACQISFIFSLTDFIICIHSLSKQPTLLKQTTRHFDSLLLTLKNSSGSESTFWGVKG